MDWTSILTVLLPLVFGGGLGSLFTLKTTRRREEFTLIKEQLELADKRNKELLEMNIEKENRFQSQTNRLRECQDREMKLNAQILELTKTIGLRDLELALKRCEIHDCPWRQPPTASTPPMPNADKTQWHIARIAQNNTADGD